MKELIEFKRRIKRVEGPRIHKVTGSLGVYDAFKFFRKTKPKDKKYILTESQYFSIVRQINNLLAEELVNGRDIKFPKRMGTLELRKYDKNIRLDEQGNLKTNLPIDWDSTLELWYNDEESRNNKTLLRHDSAEIFKIYYNKSKANYNNKSFYEFKCNKDLRQRLKQNIRYGAIDAPYLQRRAKLW
jgi:hypothetical protein